jgi:hypothetical protein
MNLSLKKRTMFLVGVALFFFISGCSSIQKPGRISIQNHEEKVNIDYLMENWLDFHVYYYGYSPQDPWAVLFDPKTDGKTIDAGQWYRVTDREQLEVLYTWMGSRGQMFVKLYKVLGPDNRVYGYMCSKRRDVNIRAVDANTLWVDSLSPPRYGP